MLKLPIDRLLKLCKDYEVIELYNLYGHYTDGFFEGCLFTQDSRYFIGLIDLIQVRMISCYGWWQENEFNLIQIDDFGRLVFKHFIFPKTNLVIMPPIPVSLRTINIPLDIDTFKESYITYINQLLRTMYLFEQLQEISNNIDISFKRSGELTTDSKYDVHDKMITSLYYQLSDEIEELCKNYPIDSI